jgi:hypothetical protein
VSTEFFGWFLVVSSSKNVCDFVGEFEAGLAEDEVGEGVEESDAE